MKNCKPLLIGLSLFLSLAANAQLSERHERWARFTVPDNQAAACLLKELMERGLPIEEAIPERTRLENLFISQRSADSGYN